MAELREVIVERFFLGIERFSRSTWTKPLRILGPRYSNERLLPQMLMHAAAFFFFFLQSFSLMETEACTKDQRKKF